MLIFHAITIPYTAHDNEKINLYGNRIGCND